MDDIDHARLLEVAQRIRQQLEPHGHAPLALNSDLLSEILTDALELALHVEHLAEELRALRALNQALLPTGGL